MWMQACMIQTTTIILSIVVVDFVIMFTPIYRARFAAIIIIIINSGMGKAEIAGFKHRSLVAHLLGASFKHSERKICVMVLVCVWCWPTGMCVFSQASTQIYSIYMYFFKIFVQVERWWPSRYWIDETTFTFDDLNDKCIWLNIFWNLSLT